MQGSGVELHWLLVTHCTQSPTPLQTWPPEPLVQAVPDGLGAVPHVELLQTACSQGLPDGVQSPALTHSTQEPLPSQTAPPFSAQADPADSGGFEPVPAVQVSAVQPRPSTGTSLSSTCETSLPEPSHSVLRQLPVASGVPGEPAVAFWTPQTPAVQVRVWHGVSVPGHSEAVVQPGVTGAQTRPVALTLSVCAPNWSFATYWRSPFSHFVL